jgi:chromate transport protein ChrA
MIIQLGYDWAGLLGGLYQQTGYVATLILIVLGLFIVKRYGDNQRNNPPIGM